MVFIRGRVVVEPGSASSGEVSSESLVLYAGLPVTAFVLLAIVVVVLVLLRRQFTWTTRGMLINYVNLYRFSPLPNCRVSLMC